MAKIYFSSWVNTRRCTYTKGMVAHTLADLGYQPVQDPTLPKGFTCIEFNGTNQFLIAERKRITNRLKIIDRNFYLIFRL